MTIEIPDFLWSALRLLGYFTGYPVLWILSAGRLKMAAIFPMPHELEYQERQGTALTIWWSPPNEPRLLKAGIVALFGMLCWMAVVFIWLKFRQ